MTRFIIASSQSATTAIKYPVLQRKAFWDRPVQETTVFVRHSVGVKYGPQFLSTDMAALLYDSPQPNPVQHSEQ